MRRLPIPRQQVCDALAGLIGDARENISKPGAGVDVINFFRPTTMPHMGQSFRAAEGFLSPFADTLTDSWPGWRVDPSVFSPSASKLRSSVERFFNKFKHYRAIATRFDRHDANVIASVKLAAIRIWMRFNEPVA